MEIRSHPHCSFSMVKIKCVKYAVAPNLVEHNHMHVFSFIGQLLHVCLPYLQRIIQAWCHNINFDCLIATGNIMELEIFIVGTKCMRNILKWLNLFNIIHFVTPPVFETCDWNLARIWAWDVQMYKKKVMAKVESLMNWKVMTK